MGNGVDGGGYFTKQIPPDSSMNVHSTLCSLQEARVSATMEKTHESMMNHIAMV
jgi:hypothetical protein